LHSLVSMKHSAAEESLYKFLLYKIFCTIDGRGQEWRRAGANGRERS
jgi:hypothetical protein